LRQAIQPGRKQPSNNARLGQTEGWDLMLTYEDAMEMMKTARNGRRKLGNNTYLEERLHPDCDRKSCAKHPMNYAVRLHSTDVVTLDPRSRAARNAGRHPPGGLVSQPAPGSPRKRLVVSRLCRPRSMGGIGEGWRGHLSGRTGGRLALTLSRDSRRSRAFVNAGTIARRKAKR
jgi:hypothetical protein